MKKISLKSIIKPILFIIGTAVTLNGIVLSFTSNFNLGNVLTLLLGIIFLLYGFYYKTASEKLPKSIKVIFVIILVIILGFVTFLLSYGTNDNATYKEDAIIVLGAGVHGETPSRILAERLNTAVEYHKQNPDAVIVVSGGQGPQETITEALAMERYLVSKGVRSEVIIREEKSTSTYENFVNSKAILDERFGNSYNVAFVTNEYHVYRAGGIARSAGIENAAHIHSSTMWYSVLPGTLRETLAVLKFWVFKN